MTATATLPHIGNYMDNGRDNSLYFEFDDVRVYYSYTTPVAFYSPGTGLICRVNDWSATTGKHLNAIEPNKAVRVPGDVFENLLSELVELDR